MLVIKSERRALKMKKERFSEILKAYNFSDKQIEKLWNSRPTDNLNEERLRKTCERFAPIKDKLVQD